MKTAKIKLNAAQMAVAAKLEALPVVQGEQRTIYLCKTCGTVQANDFIPYGMGRGCWRNMCMCNASDINWIFGQAVTLLEKAG